MLFESSQSHSSLQQTRRTPSYSKLKNEIKFRNLVMSILAVFVFMWVYFTHTSSFKEQISLPKNEGGNDSSLESKHAADYISAKRKKVVIAGLFKNNGDNLRKMYNLMKRTVGHFDDSLVILMENDSTDNTSEEIRKICKEEKNVNCLNLIFNSQLDLYLSAKKTDGPFEPYRFSKMSFFRNIVLSKVEKLTSFDYFVFVDPDLFDEAWLPEVQEIKDGLPDMTLGEWGGPARAWLPSSVLNSIRRADKQKITWNAICFYGTFGEALYQYDMLAFRPSKQTPIPQDARSFRPSWDYDTWAMKFSARSILEGKSTDKELHYGMYLFNYDGSNKFIPVRSCFGGLTIYKISALANSKCLYDEDYDDCEHVSLNDCINENYGVGSIYVDPLSYVFYDTKSFETITKRKVRP